MRTEKDVNLLVIYCRYKFAFPNSVIKTFSEAAFRSGFSRQACKKQLQKLIDAKYAKRNVKGDIILTPKRLIASRVKNRSFKRKFIKLYPNNDLKTQIQAHKIEIRLNQMAFSTSRKVAHAIGGRKRLKKYLCGKHQEMSNNAIGRLYGKSKSSGGRISTKLAKKRLISKKSSKPKFLGRCSYLKWETKEIWWNFKESITSCYIYKGKIYSRSCNSYKPTLLKYPITIS